MSEEGVDAAEVPAEDDVDEVQRRPARPPISGPKARSRRLPIILVGATAVVLVAVAAVVIKSSGSSTPKTTATTTVTTTAPVAGGLKTFQDTAAGYKLSYPASWTVSQSNDTNVPLLVSFGEGGLDTLLVRVVPMQAAQVNTANAADIKAFTDAVIFGTNVSVLKQDPITVDKLPGYYYFYRLPKDATTGVTLVHSHFFVFPPHEMVSLVFQTVDTDFEQFAAAFDQVISSFQAIPASPATPVNP